MNKNIKSLFIQLIIVVPMISVIQIMACGEEIAILFDIEKKFVTYFFAFAIFLNMFFWLRFWLKNY